MTRVGWAVGALLLVGCGRAPVGRAFVDVDRVARMDPLPLEAVDAVPEKHEAPSAPESVTITPLPAKDLDFSENQARLEKVKAAVEEAREQTSRLLARKLREAYMAEVDLLERERLAAMGDVRKEALASAWLKVRDRFLRHANARAPHAIRLALYAGFPDPDPNGKRPPSESQKALTRRFERANSERSALEELDRTYEADVRALLAQFEDEVAGKMLEIRAELERLRAEAESRAIADARSQVAAIAEQIDSVLAGKGTVRLDARPGRDATVGAGVPMPAWPEVKGLTRADWEAARQEAVRSDLKIWAAHFGWELVNDASQAPDRTSEFLAWRQQRQLGRLEP